MTIFLENTKPNYGRELGQRLGAGLVEGYQSRREKQISDLKRAKENKMIKQRLGIDLEGIEDPKSREALIGAALKGEGEKAKYQAKYTAQEEFMNRLFGKKDQEGSRQGKDQPQPQEMGGLDLEDLNAEDTMRLAMVNPAMSKVAIETAKMKSKEKATEESKRQFAHQQGGKFRDEIREEAKSGEEIKYAAKLMKDAIRSGKTGPTARNLALKYLEGSKSPLANLFQTPESGKMNLGMKAFAGGFKKIMGSKPTEREFFWYENILPNLLKNASTNEAIIDYFDQAADFSTKAQDVYDDIVQKNEGYIPIDIDVQVRRTMKPEFDRLINEGMSLMSEIETPQKKGKAKGEEQTVFSAPPDPKVNKGKILRDKDTGEAFRSDGNQWVPLNA